MDIILLPRPLQVCKPVQKSRVATDAISGIVERPNSTQPHMDGRYRAG